MAEKDTHNLKDHQRFSEEDNQGKLSRPKRVKKAPKTDDDFYVYSFRENRSSRPCEKEESNMKNAPRITNFFSKVSNDNSPDYKPGMDLKKYQKPKKANIRKRKRCTKSGLDVDNRVALTLDSHVGKSNDDNDSSFSAHSEEHHNSGLNASNDNQNNGISVSRWKTGSMARRRSASTVGPVDGKPSSSRPTSQLPLPTDVPRKGRTTSSRKRKFPEVAKSPPRNIKQNYTVIIDWLGLYSDEESDQDVVNLVNKRTERRKKLKLLQNRNYIIESVYQHSSSSSSNVHESSTSANHQGNDLVFNVESHTGKENSSSEELPARMDYEHVNDSKIQGTVKLSSSDGAINVKSEAPMEAAVKSEPVDTATSVQYDVEDVIQISD